MMTLGNIPEISRSNAVIEAFAFEAMKLRDEVFEYGDRSLISAADELMICIGRVAAQQQADQQPVVRRHAGCYDPPRLRY